MDQYLQEMECLIARARLGDAKAINDLKKELGLSIPHLVHHSMNSGQRRLPFDQIFGAAVDSCAAGSDGLADRTALESDVAKRLLDTVCSQLGAGRARQYGMRETVRA